MYYPTEESIVTKENISVYLFSKYVNIYIGILLFTIIIHFVFLNKIYIILL